MEQANMLDTTRMPSKAPMVRDLPADLETPVSAFLKLARTAPSFLLESVERGEQVGRYSILGTAPYQTLKVCQDRAIITRGQEDTSLPLGAYPGGPDPLDIVKSLMGPGSALTGVPNLPPFYGGAVGYLSYDAVRYFERMPHCPDDQLRLPEAAYMFCDTVVVFDHVQRRMKVVSGPSDHDPTATIGAGPSRRIDGIVSDLDASVPRDSRFQFGATTRGPAPISNFDQASYEKAVARAKEHIMAGDAFQIVLSQRLQRRTTAAPFSIYRALRMLNPSPYMFYLDFGSFQLIGSSPELLVKLNNGQAETRPIAGTRPRGSNPEEDARLIESLLADPKECAEHTMLVDLGRNDIGRVCRYGSVEVPVYMSVEKYSHVSHIVSSVQGELRPDCDAFDLLRACFPAGTLTGAPKVRAMEIINDLEGTRRGPYGGAVGYFGFDGAMDTCITIRTIVMVGDTVYLQAGAGIVADSDPASEYRETLNKVQVLEDAVRLAECWKEMEG